MSLFTRNVTLPTSLSLSIFGSRTFRFFWIGLSLHLVFAVDSVAQASMLDRNVEVVLREGTVGELLAELQQKSGIVLSFSNRLCLGKHIKFTSRAGTLRFFLDQLFADCPANYVARGQKVIIELLEKSPGKYIVKGFVVDHSSKERLIGANIYEANLLIGSASNSFGFFSISLPSGKTHLKCSYVGYQAYEEEFDLKCDTTLTLVLQPSIDLGEVSVWGSSIPEQVFQTSIGVVDFPVEQIRNVPAFMGEVDVLKAIQMAPGVQSGNEGIGGIYVRGGGADENMVLLDDVPMYYISHLLGIFSVFNADAIHKVTMIKSGFPSRYGGRLSSVFDIRMKEGNLEAYHGSASLGLISSNVSVEGPIVKHKSSFSFSARRTYLDLFSTPLQLRNDEKFRYYFYDVNAKLNYIFSPRDRLYLSLFTGQDDYSTLYNYKTVTIPTSDGTSQRELVLNDENGSGWGNWVMSTRWNHVFGEKLFSNVTLSFTDFRFYVDQEQSKYDNEVLQFYAQRYFSGIRDGSLKIDLDYFPSSNHHLRMGGSVTYHVFYPGVDLFSMNGLDGAVSDTLLGNARFHRPEYHAYVEDDFSLGRRFRMNAGLHVSALFTGTKYFFNLEPRLTGAWLVAPKMSVKASYTKMSQYVHLVRSASIMLPSDMWLPVSDQVKPLLSHQMAAGIEYEVRKGTSLSAEVYFKKQKNILTYTNSSGIFDLSGNWYERLTAGEGESYGLELFYHRKVGRFTGWLGYTLSKATNRFAQINGGEPFAANFDRRHDISAFGLFKIKEGVELAANWLFGTGHPVTLPTEWYLEPELPGSNAGSGHAWIGNRNNFRMPNLHRLDLGLTLTRPKKWGSHIWSFGIYNVYSRQNPFFLYFAENKQAVDESASRTLKQFSLFPIPLPYIRYTIKF